MGEEQVPPPSFQVGLLSAKMDTQLEKPMWQLLLEDPSKLTREECYAVIEYYRDLLGDDHDTLFPVIEKYLRDCPIGVLKEHLALYRMMARRQHPRQKRVLAGH
jgi:hypothetical protein